MPTRLLLAAVATVAYGPPQILPAQSVNAIRTCRHVACSAALEHNHHNQRPDGIQPDHLVTGQHARSLLDALDCFMRSQTIENVLPREQAKSLIADLRDDRRFWAQQRRQFNLLWINVAQGMRVEDRPMSEVLGQTTSARLVDALGEMEDDPALVNAVLRSEVVEQLIGHVLYEGIFDFIQGADLLGNIFNQLPIIGAIRIQMLKAARQQLDALLGDQVARFLGEYTAKAAESAATYLLSEETAEARRRARRAAAEKLLSKPIGELVAISDFEMALVRDAVWSAVQEFRLPHESELVDRLYGEFGQQPFTILLPSNSAAARGDAPLFDRSARPPRLSTRLQPCRVRAYVPRDTPRV